MNGQTGNGETGPASGESTPAEPGAVHPVPAGPIPEGSIPFARPVTGAYVTGAYATDRPFAPAHDLLLLAETRKEVWLDIGLVVLLLAAYELVAGFGLIAIAMGASGTADGASEEVKDELLRALLLPGVAVRGLGAIVIVALIVRHRGQTARSVGASTTGWALNSLIGTGATVVAYLLMAIAGLLVMLLSPAMYESMLENAEHLMKLIPQLPLVNYLPVAIMVAVYEELLFRGFLMGRLRRATGSWTVALFLSTVVFTALHAPDQTPGALVFIAILSLVFSIVTIWRRSIVPAVVAHALFDFSQFWQLSNQAGQPWT